jgi:DNA-binding PadR family transcriptional regulator
MQMIRSNSSNVLQVETGSLYPALHRLERQKWIRADWKLSDNKQRVREYRITVAGRKHLRAERGSMGTAVGSDWWHPRRAGAW